MRDKLMSRHRYGGTPGLPPPTTIRRLVVRRAARLPDEVGPRGLVKAGALTLPCSLGKAGILRDKREGDRGTPAGRMRLVAGSYRPDRLPRPFCRVPLRPLRRNDGWCDDAASPAYNRACRLPMRAGHEAMWRDDGLYDVVFTLGHNLVPRRAGRGSAIFMHCAKWDGCRAPRGDACAKRGDGETGWAMRLRPTLGCVALRPGDMRRLLPRLAARSELVVV